MPQFMPPQHFRLVAILAVLLLHAACAWQPPAPPSQGTFSIATTPAKRAATTAHPLATRAALKILDEGGAPIDAAIAAQMVLGLVEPQSSGIGGGSLIMYWDQTHKKLTSYDGLAAAPARVTPALTVDVDGSMMNSDDVQRGGRSVGVPGTLAVLKLAHASHGKLAWRNLFAPAIELAERGFPMPKYMHTILSAPTAAADHPDLLPLYFGADGKVKPIGTLIQNPAYAATMTRIAASGAEGLRTDGAGAALIAAAQRGFRASLMTEADLAAYRAEVREPLCAPFLAYSVCAMAPPSFGGVVVLQVLQMLDARAAPNNGAPRFDFDNVEFTHYYAEAGRLAQADRLQYVGDPGFVRVPTRSLVNDGYLNERARKIDASRAARDVFPGEPESNAKAALADVVDLPEGQVADATSQLAIVDATGNALSMTTTTNLNFGSRLMVDGFVLNNALTNFTGVPRAGQAAPNRMQSEKRPVTSMAPLIVFDQSGIPAVVGGSAGGGQIVDYIASSLVEMLANGRTPAEALARGHVSTAIRGKVQLEKGTPAALQAAALSAMGHDVDVVPMISGLGFLMRRDGGWIGAADPRRDGVAEGR